MILLTPQSDREKMLVNALLAKVRGEHVQVALFTDGLDKYWKDSKDTDICIKGEYRIESPKLTPLIIPDELWEYIKGDWVAMDKDGSLYSYTKSPIKDRLWWIEGDNNISHSLDGLEIETSNWEQSLVQRPEHLRK